MLIDTTPVARCGLGPLAMLVVAERQHVQFHDGSAVGLLAVMHRQVLCPTLRALEIPVFPARTELQLVDLARLLPTLRRDLAAAPRRDALGTVLFLLRQTYPTARAFTAAVDAAAAGLWTHGASPEQRQWRPRVRPGRLAA